MSKAGERGNGLGVRVSAFQRRASIGICAIFLLAGLAWPGGPVRREVALSDVPVRLREFLPAQEFPRLLDALKARTAAREQAGEYDHLIHYLLQSRAFTARPRIEPALSAREWVEGGKAIPEAVRLRMQDFLAALGQPATDVRMAYFQTMNADLPLLDREYRRAMDFLYKKEFGAGGAALYQERGHSTDSQFEANYAVYIGLAALKSKKPELALENVLVVGPGLDFAPRTDLMDAYGPQSYQPYAIADALIELGLADPARLRIHCIDINSRVVRYFERPARRLQLISGLADTPEHPLVAGFKSYFRKFGGNIGQEYPLAGLPPQYRAHLNKSISVRPEIAARITADRLNIITERCDPSPQYDLVVATNIFVYFDPTELLLALTNLRGMLKEGGYLVHNDPRSDLERFARELGLAPIEARTILISPSATPLYDTVVLHECRR